MTTTTRPTTPIAQSDLPIDQVIHSDALTALRELPSNSVDAICVDPPAGIHFMGKTFDHDKGGRDQWIAWLQEIMTEALRVIKPGGHAFVWALPRTSHWTTTAIENAGWEIREKHYHLFGSGFPKAANISKMIDQKLGIEREIVGTQVLSGNAAYEIGVTHSLYHSAEYMVTGVTTGKKEIPLTSPASPESKKWDGWFSATKPACEEWILCRKPLSEPTIAENVLKWGVGALNIGATRVPGIVPQVVQGITHRSIENSAINGAGKDVRTEKMLSNPHDNGRYPSNVTFSHSLFCTDNACSPDCPVLALEQQSGMRSSGAKTQNVGDNVNKGIYSPGKRTFDAEYQASTGTAARFYHCFPPSSPAEQDVPFFYTAKASSSERNQGIPRKIEGGLFEEYEGEGMEEGISYKGNYEGRDMSNYRNHLGGLQSSLQANTHPTIKSQSLMRYLLSLICPKNGIVLDFFAGSGSAGVAAISLEMHCILIEQSDTKEEPYVSIARSRLQHALHKRSRRLDNVE